MSTNGWSLGRRGVLALALAAVVAGLVLLAVIIKAQVNAPEPRPAGRVNPPSQTSGSSNSSGGRKVTDTKAVASPLGPSKPQSITIPAIGVNTPVYPIGLAPDGTLGVPQPGPHLNNAAWFENSPTPGQPGPSIIEGHVDSVEGPSVFLKLGDVKPGDTIYVTRADGRKLTFKVDGVRDFLKARFPTGLVYGGHGADLSLPTLRLITCSDFDASIHHHVGNEVVFAHLTHASNPSGSASN
jgi:LPXTG-site transpeptidase (sortase) family protein